MFEKARRYRRAFNASKMNARTVGKRAGELMKNAAAAARIAELRAKAAEKAIVDRAWVLERLKRNAMVCLGEQTITLRKVRTSGKDGKAPVVDQVEVTAHDAAGANRALELLGKTDEVRLFIEQHEHSGKGGGPIPIEPDPLSKLEIARGVAFLLREGARAARDLEKANGQNSA